jgi:hypothetical protein
MAHHRWKKSSRSGPNTNCVQLSATLTAVRDSKNPTGPIMTVAPSRLTAFLEATKAGRFDG